MRQLTGVEDLHQYFVISKLPMRQLTSFNLYNLAPLFSKLPMRQLTLGMNIAS